MQPCGVPTTTATSVTENRNSDGYLLPDPVDEPYPPTAPSRSSGVYSYVYDHLIDRFIWFVRIHLRHRQELYSSRNQRPTSRPSSVPPTQAPHPPDQPPPSSPLIPSSPPEGGDCRIDGNFSPDDESIEDRSQTLSRVSFPSECACSKSPVYENVPNNEIIEYADVAACV